MMGCRVHHQHTLQFQEHPLHRTTLLNQCTIQLYCTAHHMNHYYTAPHIVVALHSTILYCTLLLHRAALHNCAAHPLPPRPTLPCTHHSQRAPHTALSAWPHVCPQQQAEDG